MPEARSRLSHDLVLMILTSYCPDVPCSNREVDVTATELVRTPALTTARAGFGAVVAAASVSGLALMIWPEEAGRFFSWGLGPPPLASLVGGLYLASAVTFAVAMRLPWRSARSLVAASVVLTTPTLIATFAHLGVFDFDRWQAWAWIGLFVAAPPFWIAMLVVNRSAIHGVDVPIRWPVAVPMLVLTVLLVGLAISLWADPSAGARVLPFEPSLLGGRFIGCWMAFLAAMAAWTALNPPESELPLLALTVYPAGALLAGLRSLADLAPPGTRSAYLVVLGIASIVCGILLIRTWKGRGS